MSKERLTVREMAKRLNCSEETIRRRLRSGSAPAIKLGHYRIDPEAFELSLSNRQSGKPKGN